MRWVEILILKEEKMQNYPAHTIIIHWTCEIEHESVFWKKNMNMIWSLTIKLELCVALNASRGADSSWLEAFIGASMMMYYFDTFYSCIERNRAIFECARWPSARDKLSRFASVIFHCQNWWDSFSLHCWHNSIPLCRWVARLWHFSLTS